VKYRAEGTIAMTVVDEPLPDDAGQLPALPVRDLAVRVQPLADCHLGAERLHARELGFGPRS
jgi:hypothetical protein